MECLLLPAGIMVGLVQYFIADANVRPVAESLRRKWKNMDAAWCKICTCCNCWCDLCLRGRGFNGNWSSGTINKCVDIKSDGNVKGKFWRKALIISSGMEFPTEPVINYLASLFHYIPGCSWRLQLILKHFCILIFTVQLRLETEF